MNSEVRSLGLRAVPIPNSYWVRPGQLLAGEYPGSMSRAEAMERVQSLVRAGVNSFLDLTEDGELPPYEAMLSGLNERRVQYRRLSIEDHGVPHTAAVMNRILDYIDAELAAGRCVYVHCRAGIGRTGTTVGCHLVRSGLENHAALEQLQVLWQQCARSQRWLSVPENERQRQYILQWSVDSSLPAVSGLEQAARLEGALVGLAIGDALGSLVANSNFDAATLAATGAARDGGVLIAGALTACTRAVAESLLARGGHDPQDQMQRYLDWTRTADATAVPAPLRRALGSWQWSGKPVAGSHDPKNLDAHPLVRSLAAAMFARSDAQQAMALAVELSRTTLQSPVVLDLCRLWAASFVDALNGVPRDRLQAMQGPAMQVLRQRKLKPQVQAILDGKALDSAPDDALGVTLAAWRGFSAAPDLHQALLHVVAASRAAPAAAALCGALCGAHWGLDAITPQLRDQLPEQVALRAVARQMLK